MPLRLLTVALVPVVLSACGGRIDVGSNRTGDLTPAEDAASESARPLADVVALGTSHGCALLEDSTVACWGFNPTGQAGVSPEESLKDGSGSPYVDPPRRVAGLRDVRQVSADWQSSCALTRSGHVYVWGALRTPELYGDAPDDRHVPKKVEELEGVVEVRCSGTSACARKGDGSVWCWGRNTYLSVGPTKQPENTGSPMNEVLPPTRVARIDDAISIAISDTTACAIHASAELSCWGRVEVVEDTYVPDSATPVRIEGVRGLRQIALAQTSMIARMDDGRVMVFGGGGRDKGILHRYGSEPDPNVTSYHDAVAPQYVPELTDIVEVAGSYQTLCAARSDGVVRCWGDNYSGGLGLGKTHGVPIYEPTELPDLRTTRVSVGTWGGCGDVRDVGLVCWGSGHAGSLGLGQPPARTPSKPGPPVVLPAPIAR